MLLIAAPSTSPATDFGYLQALHDTRYHRLTARDIGRDFHIYVMLPDGYAGQSDVQYRTIYLLDGGMSLPLLGGAYRYLRLGDETEASILVAIAYGANDFAGGNFRSTDFTAAAAERDYWGGAPRFQRFIADELQPFVEARYRSDPERRILFGHSLGGQFVLHVAQTEPELFSGYIASNPALHRNLPFFLGTRPDRDSKSALFVASASRDEPRFREPALAWMRHWTAQTSLPWRLETADLIDHTHLSSPAVAFWRGLDWLQGLGGPGP